MIEKNTNYDCRGKNNKRSIKIPLKTTFYFFNKIK